MQLARYGREVGIGQVHRGTSKQGQTLVGEWNGRGQGGFAPVGKKAARGRRLAQVVPLPATRNFKLFSAFANLRTHHAAGPASEFGTCSTGGDLDALNRRRLHVHSKAGARQGILGAYAVDQVLGFVDARPSNLQSVGGLGNSRLSSHSVFNVTDVHLAQFINADEPLAARSL